MQNAVSYYNIAWLDTSQISAINLGTDLADYTVDTQSSVAVKNNDNAEPFFVCQLVQSRRKNEITWSISSLDVILGLVGGFTSVIWSLLAMVITPYEDFKF